MSEYTEVYFYPNRRTPPRNAGTWYRKNGSAFFFEAGLNLVPPSVLKKILGHLGFKEALTEGVVVIGNVIKTKRKTTGQKQLDQDDELISLNSLNVQQAEEEITSQTDVNRLANWRIIEEKGKNRNQVIAAIDKKRGELGIS